MLQKQEQAPKCGSNEEEKIVDQEENKFCDINLTLSSLVWQIEWDRYMKSKDIYRPQQTQQKYLWVSQ
jgi:hypothetical protein